MSDIKDALHTVLEASKAANKQETLNEQIKAMLEEQERQSQTVLPDRQPEQYPTQPSDSGA